MEKLATYSTILKDGPAIETITKTRKKQNTQKQTHHKTQTTQKHKKT